MPRPQLTFFTELSSEALVRLFDAPEPLAFLVRGGHRLSMGMLDFSPERAEVIRRLEAAGVDVTAWLLLGEEDGYWLNADNAPAAMQRYAALHAYGRREKLELRRLGLDIEPPKPQLDQLLKDEGGTTLRRFRQRRALSVVEEAERAYEKLITLARRDGRQVESYQFPFIVDERRAQSHLLRRTFGLVDVEVDTEVLMLYRSHFGIEGCRAYYADADAIALGVTGGGVYAEDEQVEPKLSWPELRDDLLAAARSTSSVYVFSFEGCVEQGMLEAIDALQWDEEPKPIDQAALRRAHRERQMRSLLARSEGLFDALLPARSSRG